MVKLNDGILQHKEGKKVFFNRKCIFICEFFFSKKICILYPGVYLKAGRHQESPSVTVILATVLECVKMHIYCLKVNIAGCRLFSGFFRLL